MSSYDKTFCGEYGHIKCKTIKKWTDELKDANNKERVEKAKAEIEKHKKIAREVEELLK